MNGLIQSEKSGTFILGKYVLGYKLYPSFGKQPSNVFG